MKDSTLHNKTVYNTIAKHFSDTRSWTTEDIAALGEYVRAGDRVLDLACGNGRLYQLLVEQKKASAIEYVGIDFSENLLAMAKSRFPNVDFRFGDMTNIPCDDASVDIVFCLAAFHHLATDADRLQTLREIKRVLRPGGTLVMTNWNIFSDWAKEKLATGKWKQGEREKEIIVPWKDAEGNALGERLYYAYTPEEIVTWCKEIGLEVREQYFAAKKGTGGDTSVGMNIVSIMRRS